MYGITSHCKFHSIDNISIFIPVPHYSDYCSFIVSFENGKWVSSKFFSRLFLLFGSLLWFHMNSKTGISIYAKKIIVVIFRAIALNL